MSTFVFQNGYKIVSPAPSGNAGEVLNENFTRSSNIPHRQPALKYISTPPVSPSKGDRYLIGSSATGAWSGQEDKIAEYIDSTWQFITPACGWIIGIEDLKIQYQFNGTSWIPLQTCKVIRNVSANTTVNLNDSVINVDATGGNRTVTLLPAAQTIGLVYRIYKIDSSTNTVTIDGDGTEEINGSETIIIEKQYRNISVTSDGTNYIIVGQIPTLPLLVDQSGAGDAKTISGALTLVNSFSPSVTNPYLIEVAPDTYSNETNPLVIPPGVSLVSLGGSDTCIIEPVTTTSAIFELSSNTLLEGFTVKGADGAGGIGIKASGGSTSGVVKDCTIRDSTTGILATGSGTTLSVVGTLVIRIPGETLTNGIVAESGALINASQPLVFGTTVSSIINGIYANGGTINAVNSVVSYCTNGIYANSDGIISDQSANIAFCTNAIRTGTSGSSNVIRSPATIITDSTTYDIYAENSTGVIELTGIIDAYKRSIASGSVVNSVGVDINNNRALLSGGAKVEGDLSVGVPGGEYVYTYIGEGGRYLKDQYGTDVVEYWSYDDSAASGSKFTRFTSNGGTQLTANNDAIVVGSVYKFSVIDLAISTAAVLGGGSIVLEYWNGSSWVQSDFATYGDREDLNFRGITPLVNVETQMIESNKFILDSLVAANNVANQIPAWSDGNSHYAIRLRNSGAITSGAAFNNGLVRGSDLSIHSDDDIIMWGASRGSGNISLLPSLILQSVSNTPLDENIDFSANIEISGVRNEFSGGALDKVLYILRLPTWIDTASPAKIRVNGFQSGTASGNIELQIRLAPFVVGSAVNSGTLTEFGPFTDIITVPGVSGQLIQHEIEVSLPGTAPGTDVAIALERDGSSGNADDTCSDNYVMVNIDIELSRKRLD